MTDRVGQQLGRYRFIRLLGRGSFSEVYLGEHLYLKSQSAIKVLNAQLAGEDVKGFLNEAQTIARLVHPNIIRIFDFEVESGTPFLVMDYASNGTLRQRHPKGTPIPLNTVVYYTRQLAGALQYAHDHNFIHCDVKPENMLLGRGNEILLSDFGIVQVAQSTQINGAQEIAGTVAYMAPEQFQGKARFSSDQYALGVAVYEWLCGDRPFQGSFVQMANLHLFTPPQPLREKNPAISPAVEEVVMTALAKDPKQRFASVAAFARALEQASLSISSFPSVSTYAPPSPIPFTSSPAASQSAQGQQLSPIVPISSTNPNSKTPAPLFTDPPAPIQPQLIAPAQPDQLTAPAQPDYAKYHPAGISTSTDKPPQQQRKKQTVRIFFLLALIILIVASTLTTVALLKKPPSVSPTGNGNVANGIGVNKALDGEYIGISDGSFAFDTNRPDGALKLQAADKFKAGNISGAMTLWQAAIKQETNDAEALIYLEDERVLASGHPYITLVVGTLLTGDFVSIGRDNLQGAYVAQKEYNDASKLPGKVQVRLLTANSGNEAAYATQVAQQIVRAAQLDKTIIGVVGWPFSASTKNAIKVLDMAHLPIISAMVPDDSLTGISPYFFRVVPSYKRQVLGSIEYAEQKLHAKKAALFVDPGDTYSKNLAFDFQQQFIATGNSIVATENYTTGHPQTLGGLLANALNANPDLIYFSGNAQDVITLLMNLPTSGPFANLQVIGGDALLGEGSYPGSASNGFNRLHFSESVAFNEWEALGLSAKAPVFFTEYAQSFDPDRQHTGNPHGFTRADNTSILSYDALLALLGASSIALSGNKVHLSPSDLQQGLTKITGAQSIQGASGQISFGPDGEPINKAVIILKLNPLGDFSVETAYGNLLAPVS